MWYALPKRATGRCAHPGPDDTALSLPTGTSPRHLPGSLPGGPPQSSWGLCRRGEARGEQRAGEGQEGNRIRTGLVNGRQMSFPLLLAQCWIAGTLATLEPGPTL